MLNVGMVTYGNLKYTKLAVDSLFYHTTTPFNFVIVIGKPNDLKTQTWASARNIKTIVHDINKGFPASINDIYDYYWADGSNTEPIVLLGNDIVVYSGAVDKLYERYQSHGTDWVSSTELYTAKKFTSSFPQVLCKFRNDREIKENTGFRFITDLYGATADYVADMSEYKIIGDAHNLCLFSHNLFKTIGYIDVNFFPAYFEDNDYGRRAILSKKLSLVRLGYSHYFHFWSRTIYEENMRVTNDKYFPMNKKYYKRKWGGEPGKETFDTSHHPNMNIFSRENESRVLDYWRNM